MSGLEKMQRISSLTLLLLLTCLTGRCRAEVDTNMIIGICIPAVLFAVATTIICVCFWICYCNVSKQYNGRRPTERLPSLNETTYCPESQSAIARSYQIHPVQNYASPSPTALSHTPTDSVASSGTSECLLPPTEPASLPDATLHKGEAPPAYAEAIKLATVIVIDQSN